MAKIETINNTEDDMTIVDIEVTKEELKALSGVLSGIVLFSEENLEHNSRLIKRGKNESTKYFLLPKQLRDGVNSSKNVACSKIETEKSNIFVFSVPKQVLEN